MRHTSEHAKPRAVRIALMPGTLVLLGCYLTRQIYLLGKLIMHADERCSMTWHGSGQVLAQGHLSACCMAATVHLYFICIHRSMPYNSHAALLRTQPC